MEWMEHELFHMIANLKEGLQSYREKLVIHQASLETSIKLKLQRIQASQVQ